MNNPTYVVTGKVRLSYAHLFTPYANPNGGEAKYSTTVLVPKSDYATRATHRCCYTSSYASRY